MNQFTSLPPSQRKSYLDHLRAEHSALLKKEKAIAFKNRPACPYCKQTHVHSVGFRNGIQHYRCTNCHKSYSARTGTSFYWIHHRHKFDLYMNDMLTNGHKPLRQMCRIYNISLITAFDWRHKILAALNCSPKQFKGLIELRNCAYRFSKKGARLSKSAKNNAKCSTTPVQLLIVADYNNNSGIDIARIGKLRNSDIETHLLKRIDEDHVIVSPYNKGISDFAKTKKLAITTFSKRNNPHQLDDKMTKTLNEKLMQLIIDKTRGVSTKYLWHYTRWLLLSQSKPNLQKISNDIALNTSAWSGYTALEADYRHFISNFSVEPYIQTSNRIWKKRFKLLVV